VQLIPIDEILRFGDEEFAMTIAKDTDGSVYARYLKLRKEKLKLGTKHVKDSKRTRSRSMEDGDFNQRDNSTRL
jgi:hypothetical protein